MSSIIFAGSPRKGMYSDRLAEFYGRMTDGKVIYLRDLNIKPCKACGFCKDTAKGVCVQPDEMQDLYPLLREADEIAIFSPVYWWQVTAQAKLFIDRLYALQQEEFKGKRFVIAVNGGASVADKEYEILKDAFTEMAEYLNADLHFAGVSTPEGDEEAFSDALQAVSRLYK